VGRICKAYFGRTEGELEIGPPERNFKSATGLYRENLTKSRKKSPEEFVEEFETEGPSITPRWNFRPESQEKGDSEGGAHGRGNGQRPRLVVRIMGGNFIGTVLFPLKGEGRA